jgi:hypothetical protein
MKERHQGRQRSGESGVGLPIGRFYNMAQYVEASCITMPSARDLASGTKFGTRNQARQTKLNVARHAHSMLRSIHVLTHTLELRECA